MYGSIVPYQSSQRQVRAGSLGQVYRDGVLGAYAYRDGVLGFVQPRATRDGSLGAIVTPIGDDAPTPPTTAPPLAPVATTTGYQIPAPVVYGGIAVAGLLVVLYFVRRK